MRLQGGWALALAAVGGGLVGALAMVVLEVGRRQALPARAPVPPRVEVANGELADGGPASEELAELRAALQRLAERVELLEAASELGPRLPADLVTRAELEALRQELARASEPSAAPALPSDAQLRESVEATLRAVEKERAVARMEAGLEEQRASLEVRVRKYGDWLGLDEPQRGRLREALLERSDLDAELLRQWAAGADAELLAARKLENAQRFATRVEGFLSPEQLERFRERMEK